jgi:hypothetical protein
LNLVMVEALGAAEGQLVEDLNHIVAFFLTFDPFFIPSKASS